MNIDPILSQAHGGAAILLLSLAMISVVLSVLIAVKPAIDPANIVLVRRANFIGILELIVAVMLTLTGLVVMYMGSLLLSQLWLWLSLMIMVFYIVALVWVTKPARLVVADGGSAVKSGMQVILHIGHVLLVFVAYSLMVLKPI